jgi:hypothetical protein
MLNIMCLFVVFICRHLIIWCHLIEIDLNSAWFYHNLEEMCCRSIDIVPKVCQNVMPEYARVVMETILSPLITYPAIVLSKFILSFIFVIVCSLLSGNKYESVQAYYYLFICIVIGDPIIRGEFCWYWWNCWPSMFKLYFYKKCDVKH